MQTRQWIPAGGLLVTIIATCFMAVLNAQQGAQPADYRNAATAQVKDAQGQIILEGPFMMPVEEDGDLERQATLAPNGIDTDAAGEAEVEFEATTPAKQEVEFSVRNLTPSAVFTFAIDGTDVASAKTDSRGRAEVELDVTLPGATASR